jgi:hypothetical protein
MSLSFLNTGRIYDADKITGSEMAPIMVHSKHLDKTIEKRKFIKHAKRLGFNSSEIRKFLVYWNK